MRASRAVPEVEGEGREQVFEETPRRVGDAFDIRSSQVFGQISNGLLEVQMSASALQQIQNVFSECLIVHQQFSVFFRVLTICAVEG